MKLLFSSLLILFFTLSCSSQNKILPQDQKGLSIAVVNFKIKGNQSFEEHFRRLSEIAKRSQKLGAHYLLLPELIVFDLLPENPSKEEMKNELDKLGALTSRYQNHLKSLAQNHEINIIGASLVIKEKNHYLNRAHYITKNGDIHFQDKVWPTPWEKKYDFRGSNRIKLFKNPDFSFVILICHDAEFPALSASLLKKRPEIIFVPSQTDNKAGLNRVYRTSSARSIEHMSYVLMTGASGVETAPWHTYVGQNFFFTPQNKYFTEEIQKGSYNQEEISIFKVDLETLRESREDPDQVYPARDEI